MKKYIIYGANGIASKEAFDYLSKIGEVIACSDGNSELWGKSFYDVKCVPPQDLIGTDAEVINTITTNCEVAKRFLLSIGIESTTFANILYAGNKRVDKARTLFTDKNSICTFDVLLNAKRTADLSEIPNIILPDIGSFQRFILPNGNRTIAFVFASGGSIESYFNMTPTVKKMYAFEPQRQKYDALVSRCDRISKEMAIEKEKIVCENIDFNNEYSIDDYFAAKSVDYIEMDVHKDELAIIIGASETIKKYKPHVSVVLHHTAEAFYEIPLYLKKVVPEYKMYLTHHTRTTCKTILHAFI